MSSSLPVSSALLQPAAAAAVLGARQQGHRLEQQDKTGVWRSLVRRYWKELCAHSTCRFDLRTEVSLLFQSLSLRFVSSIKINVTLSSICDSRLSSCPDYDPYGTVGYGTFQLQPQRVYFDPFPVTLRKGLLMRPGTSLAPLSCRAEQQQQSPSNLMLRAAPPDSDLARTKAEAKTGTRAPRYPVPASRRPAAC